MRTGNTTGGSELAGAGAEPVPPPDGVDESAPRPPSPSPSLSHGGDDEPLSTEAFLGVIGRRVRSRRAALHMTRRSLAAASGVSERYLAQLESGQGNMSISLLRKVATALALPLAELVTDDAADLERDAIVSSAAATP